MAEELTSLEALGIAIRSELDAHDLYVGLASRITNPMAKDKILFLAQEEKKHKDLLDQSYRIRYPEVEFVMPPSVLPTGKAESFLEDKSDLKEVIAFAIEQEKASKEFYRKAANHVLDIRGRQMLEYLAHVEQSHQNLLEAEYQLAMTNPQYLYTEGIEMVFIGP
jgi:rubrerythrin